MSIEISPKTQPEKPKGEKAFTDIEVLKTGRLVFEYAIEGKPEECAFAVFEMTFAEIEKMKKDKRFIVWRERAKVAMTGFLSKEILDAIRIQAKNSKTTDMIPKLSELVDLAKSKGTVHKIFQKAAEHRGEERQSSFNISITIPQEEQNGAEKNAIQTAGQ